MNPLKILINKTVKLNNILFSKATTKKSNRKILTCTRKHICGRYDPSSQWNNCDEYEP